MWGWLARRKHPKACVYLLVIVFVKATGINMQEAADSPSHLSGGSFTLPETRRQTY